MAKKPDARRVEELEEAIEKIREETWRPRQTLAGFVMRLR
jgi:hypothetical protein